MADIKSNHGGINMDLMRSSPEDAQSHRIGRDRRRRMPEAHWIEGCHAAHGAEGEALARLQRFVVVAPLDRGADSVVPPGRRTAIVAPPNRGAATIAPPDQRNAIIALPGRGSTAAAPLDQGASVGHASEGHRCAWCRRCARLGAPPPFALGEPQPHTRLGGRHRSCIGVGRKK
jgi:hypothetical protein